MTDFEQKDMDESFGVPRSSYRSWKSWDDQGFGIISQEQAAYFELELRMAGIVPSLNSSMLEIGFGNGEFLSWAEPKFGSCTGTELDEELIDRARERGFECHSATLDLTKIADGKVYDCIFAFDVFEHLTVEELVTLLRSASMCLADDGMILARFPSGDSPFARSVQYGDLTHKIVIGSGIIQQIASDAGLTILAIRAPAFPIIGLGIRKSLRRGAVALLEKTIAKLINMGFHGNQPKVINQNMVVVLRKQ